MTTINTTRVSERGRVTGQAALSVERAGDTVHVKLGMTRIEVSADRWAELVRPTLEEPKPAGAYGGYTAGQLRAAWELVRPPGNWKGPIDAIVGEDADTAAISAACSLYAGTEAIIVRTRGGHRVTGTGYYANIGS
jgi:hypothetical protein